MDGNERGEYAEANTASDRVNTTFMGDVPNALTRNNVELHQILGINVFTYMLAAAIAFFLGMNAILGPGWLGNALGILSGWDLTETSKSLPDAIDLSNPDYRL